MRGGSSPQTVANLMFTPQSSFAKATSAISAEPVCGVPGARLSFAPRAGSIPRTAFSLSIPRSEQTEGAAALRRREKC
jgi:hypothetical protein